MKIIKRKKKDLIALRVPENLHAKIVEIAKKENCSKTDVILSALYQALGKVG